MPYRTPVAYVTAAEIKAFADITDTDQDALLDDLALAASERIDRFTGTWFASETMTLEHDYYESHLLRLRCDLLTVTTLTNGDGTTITADKYWLDPVSGPPYRRIEIKPTSGVVFTYSGTAKRAISIEGTWGYAATAPQTVKEVAIEMVLWMLNRAPDHGMTSASSAFGSRQYSDEMPQEMFNKLRSYRRPKVITIA